ncbi:MAG TPA: nucleotide disphospho-sugar-binding domain-containing protein [Acidimicrobiales bacterium]
MRALFVCQPAYGHFHPLVPLATACEDAGHDVAFAVSPSFVPMVEAAGFEAIAAGLDWLESEPERAFPETAGMAPEELGPFLFMQVFLEHAAAAMAGDLPAVCEQWSADLLVHESIEFGTPMAAERMGLPWATVVVQATWPRSAWMDWLAPALDRLRPDFGLPPDPTLERLFAGLRLACHPPSFELAGDPERWVPGLRRLRPVPYDGPQPPPPWLEELGGGERPSVLVTLGTVFNRSGSDVLGTVVRALGEEPVDVVVAAGHAATDFGALPDNVRVEPWVPLSAAARVVDVVGGHGGWGTTTATLAAGKPSLVLPQGADQPDNAFRVAAAGAGLCLSRAEVTGEAVRAAVRELLEEPLYFANAQRLRRELEAMPSPAEVVPFLVEATQPPG